MKKISLVLLILFLFSSGVFGQPGSGQNDGETARDLATVTRNIKLLANALELYANDHYREYPTSEQFYSKKFDKYILKALGKEKADTDQFYRCPPDGILKYERATEALSYKLWCAHPQKYGIKALYFSPGEGFVKDTGDEKAEKVEDVSLYDVPGKEEKSEVSPPEKEAMISVIKQLYEAYKNRDLEKVMDLEKEAIVRDGLRMEKAGKYKALEVYYAYKGTANDVFRAPGFGMKPLNLDDVRFSKKGKTYRVESIRPIIATNRVQVGTMKVQLRISEFHFEKIDDEFKIVKMQMY